MVAITLTLPSLCDGSLPLPQCGRGVCGESGGAAGRVFGRPAVGAFPLENVVAGEGDRVERLGQLHLEDEMTVAAKGDLGADQVHLPHPAEALVVELADALAIVLE